MPKFLESKKETRPAIPAVSPYQFRMSDDGRYITVWNPMETDPQKQKRGFLVSTLRNYIRLPETPEYLRAMAREALAEFDLLPKEEEELVSDTITVIDGVKVYQELTPPRRFFVDLPERGRVYRGRPGDLEKVIKGVGPCR